MSLFENSRLLWKHPRPIRTRVEALRQMINHRHGLNLKDYDELHAYSITNDTFWVDLWTFLGIVSSVAPDPSKIRVEGNAPYLPKWFPDVRMNYAENCLKRRDDAIAITYAREDAIAPNTNTRAQVQHVTWRQLRIQVAFHAGALRAEGVQVGDRVGAILTNRPEAIALALAVSAIGAILSPTAPDMGANGVLERYKQIQPRLIVAETSYVYAGKFIDMVPKLREVTTVLERYGLKKLVLVTGARDNRPGTHGLRNTEDIQDFLPRSRHGDSEDHVEFEQLPFGQPLFILFSSGTSGPPKCIVHCGGGVLLQNMKDNGVALGMGIDDTYLQFTTTGWMMWPYMLSGLALGTRLIAFDGSPFHPDVREFLKFISKERITLFGTSPRFLSEVKRAGIVPYKLAPFDSLRTLASTGAVLTIPLFEWAQQAFNKDVHLTSGSGGTDICAPFVTGIESKPVYAGEIQGKALGMAVEVFDPSGKNIEHTAQPGELVCTRPHPSLPIGFWGDPDGEKLRKAYFDFYPGIWRQGDFIVVNPKTRGLMILGRSDGVLNPSGVRFGSAEIYTVLEAPPAPFDFSKSIADALCVGQRRPNDMDERVMLFLLMKPGYKLTMKIKEEIKEAIRKALSTRHVPAFIFEVDDIPYTVNSKKIEIAVKQIVSGSKLTPSGTVANPESLQQYYKFIDPEKLEAEATRAKSKSKL